MSACLLLSSQRSYEHTEKVTYYPVMGEWSLSDTGVVIPGSCTFPSCLGHVQTFSVYAFGTEMSLSVCDLAGGLLFAEGFFACEENFALTK